jgi:hypothetical protein
VVHLFSGFKQNNPPPHSSMDLFMRIKRAKMQITGLESVAYSGILLGGGREIQQVQLMAEGIENEDLGAVAP